MVKGLEQFREYFAPYASQYILIGGTAATLAMADAGLEFRATKDLDIVLCVEVLNPDFVKTFWSFVNDGGYEIREGSSGKPRFYRFQKPSNAAFPSMLELFSRIPEDLEVVGGSHLTPIPVDEEVSSLSAILLDSDYYQFVTTQRVESDGLSRIGAECLIPLKAKAWLDLSERKANGGDVDSKTILKHRNDVIRLAQLLAPEPAVELPSRIHAELTRFIGHLEADASLHPASLGVHGSRTEVLARIMQTYRTREQATHL